MKQTLLKPFFSFLLLFCGIIANAQESIKFTEEESISVNEDFIKEQFGLSKLILAAGEYEVKFDENPNGRIDFNVEGIDPETPTINENGFLFAIRIARKVCKNYKSECAGCFGFKCGFITIRFREVPDLTDPRTAEVDLKLVNDGKTLRLDFTKPVDFKLMQE